jgi:ubiquinol-cytochrome c reductase cytochrome b subunit
VGAKPAEGIYIVIGRIATVWYFAHFLVIIPLLAKFEKTKELPKSISEPVLGGGGGGVVGAAAKPMGKA